MELDKTQLNYFTKSLSEANKFWSRFPEKIHFNKKTVLDIGCGDGALCIDIASKGAKKIIGIDINNEIIDFAVKNLYYNFHNLKNIVEFKIGDVSSLSSSEKFDIIVSRSAFEHILNPAECLKGIKLRLKPGGKAYIGFGPLYNSPLGDHGITKLIFGVRLPWAHAILPESLLLRKWNKKHPSNKIKGISDLGLNMLSLAKFKSLFYESGMQVLYFKINSSKRFLSKIFSMLYRLLLLSEYLSFNIYCILQNTDY